MASTPESLSGSVEHEAIGQSNTFLAFQEQLSGVARVDRPVLIIGERGTGKELAARRVHYLSRRWQEPLVALNCSALAPTLIESELFGHEAGAFTGASGRRIGRFERADGGTLFLDELGQIPLEVQEKILRVVEYGTFERVGGDQPVQVDVRIVGATNADLPALAREGAFMPDLLDRISFEVLRAPPLRERKDDIMVLARHFAGRMAMELGFEEAPEFSAAAVRQLEEHPWCGNVRELKNAAERAVFHSGGRRIREVVLDPFRREEAPEAAPAEDNGEKAPCSDFRGEVARFEVRLLRQGLAAARYNQREAAHALGLTYNQFRGLYRKYGDELSED